MAFTLLHPTQLGESAGEMRERNSLRKDVEACNDLDPVPPEPKAGEHHLAQAEERTEAREVADRYDADEVEKEDCQGRVFHAHVEDPLAEHANGKGRDDQIGREPLQNMVRRCVSLESEAGGSP